MTDKEALLAYRLREAEETLADARTLLEAGGSTRTVINRSYYAMFYSLLALFYPGGDRDTNVQACRRDRSVR